jgi:hypothetical protein
MVDTMGQKGAAMLKDADGNTISMGHLKSASIFSIAGLLEKLLSYFKTSSLFLLKLSVILLVVFVCLRKVFFRFFECICCVSKLSQVRGPVGWLFSSIRDLCGSAEMLFVRKPETLAKKKHLNGRYGFDNFGSGNANGINRNEVRYYDANTNSYSSTQNNNAGIAGGSGYGSNYGSHGSHGGMHPANSTSSYSSTGSAFTQSSSMSSHESGAGWEDGNGNSLEGHVENQILGSGSFNTNHSHNNSGSLNGSARGNSLAPGGASAGSHANSAIVGTHPLAPPTIPQSTNAIGSTFGSIFGSELKVKRKLD